MKTINLSLAEAHASGKKYRPVGSDYKYFRVEHGDSFTYDYVFGVKFELEPEAKLLTREDVWAALKRFGYLHPDERRHLCDALFGSEGGDK